MTDTNPVEDLKYSQAKQKVSHMRTADDWFWINYYEKYLVKNTLKEK